MRMQITRYGLSIAECGWDGQGDHETDQWRGNVGNTLTLASCAPTDSALRALGARHGSIIKLAFDDGTFQYREVADRAPEANQRIDCFYPWEEPKWLPDSAEVTLIRF